MKIIAETGRLLLSELGQTDAGFIFRLMNSPGWLEFIGDRNITDEAAALAYLREGTLKSYRENGFGSWLITEKLTGEQVGSAGIYKRDFLDHPDLGYALLPGFEGKGFALEAAEKVTELAAERFGIPVLSAITSRSNYRSGNLLTKIGFVQTGEMTWPQTEEILLVYEKKLRV